jgi:uncharacterized protein (DUF2141 family)
LITLLSGAAATGQNFGDFRTVGIAGVKFNDLNANGVRDVGEPGLTGWRIRLARQGVPADSALTDSAGSYLFKNLTAGTYTVSELQQNGWTQSLPGSPGTYTIVITSGSSASARDFGNYQRGSISGMAFLDFNGNGSKDTVDTPLSGRLIRISGAKVDSALTDAGGAYTFTNLVPGTYGLSQLVPGGWVQTLPASAAPYAVVLSSGQNSTGKNFGSFRLGTISGVQFTDVAGNGVRDSGDLPLSGWKLRLILNSAVVDSVVTDSSGRYAFTSVGPGAQTVGEVVQSGWIQTTPPSPGSYAITMTSGAAVPGRDFGNFQLGKISGMKFNDQNGNGGKDNAEPGLKGWTIRLSGARTDSAVTDSAGRYSFDNLRAGAYQVAEVQQQGWTQTMPPGSAGYSIGITSGTRAASIDFGNALVGILAGSVRSGWNMVSVPLVPENGDMHKNILFPTATSVAFGYLGQYTVESSLQLGRGYWMKFGADQMVNIRGPEVRQDTVMITRGWNFVGTPSRKMPVSQVRTDPPNDLISHFFGYNGGYQVADSLKPFQGYWVKADTSGRLFLISGTNLPTQAIRNNAGAGEERSDRFNRITFRDPRGNTQTLFFADDERVGGNRIELPPVPPEGTFDVRFSDGGIVEAYPARNHSPRTYRITIQTEQLSLQVSWAIVDPGVRVELFDARGGNGHISQSLRGEGSLNLAEAPAAGLQLRISPVDELPAEYSLEQNYPNPFNSSTEIRYALPATSRVTLTIFNTLGQLAEKLVDEIQPGGHYQIRWSPANATGIYFYRLEATSMKGSARSFMRIKKMLIVR